MKSYILGRLNDGSVHLFSKYARTVGWGVPECRVVEGDYIFMQAESAKSGDPKGEVLTCNKCRAILYGGGAEEYKD